MNSAEQSFLLREALSHEARSLYLLYLRPRAEQGQLMISLAEISSYLSTSSSVMPVSASPAFCEQVLNELISHGLITCQDPDAAPFGTLTLPLFEGELNEVPSVPFMMHAGWRPGAGFIHAARISGLADTTFTETELSSFVAYWQGKPEKRNQIAWERAFCQRLLRQRSARVRAENRARHLTRRNTEGQAVAESGDFIPMPH